MAKLVATYAEGFFAVFTESRSGMQQRALIDIGDKVPTPKEMAELAGTLSDHWGWDKQIQPATAKPVRAIAHPTSKPIRDRDIPVKERKTRIVGYLATHPESGIRQIVTGLGFNPSEKLVGRWGFTLTTMVQANLIIRRKIDENATRGLGAAYLYSLPS